MNATVKPYMQDRKSVENITEACGFQPINTHQPDDVCEPAGRFFRTLNVERLKLPGSMGGDWASLPHMERMSMRLQQVDMALAGIDGVAEVLHAAEQALCAEQDSLNENLRDRLFYALRTLSSLARIELEEARLAAEGGR